MCWNCRLVLLSFCSLLMKALAQLSENTPPTMWMDNRDWKLSANETVGIKIAQAHGDDAENDNLTYGLEPIHFYGTKGPPLKIPFRIDSHTGTVYLNESLTGRAGENLHFYVTVNDGEFKAKSEINVNIQDPRMPYNPSKPSKPSFPVGQNPGFLNYPGMFSRPRAPPPPAHVPNYNVPARPPYFQQKTMTPPRNNETDKFTTQLKPVPVEKDQIENDIPEEKETSKSVEETTERKGKVEVESTNELEPTPVKSNEFTIAVIPIISVCVVFVAIGATVLFFRRKIHFGKRQDSKDDMRKDSSGVTMQEDNGLTLHEWIGPRAFSNRYEPWQTDPERTQVEHQLSDSVKNIDQWEFPRHRLKFYNILGEGAFGQVWKCEALNIEGTDSGTSIVAVKTLKENANDKERSDLISELQVMKSLDPHPNVVTLLGCCTEKEPIFLIMEYIAMGKLQTYLRNSRAERYYNNMHGKSKSLTSRDLTSFVYQVAKGMEFLSNVGIIHRDLAARNILITEDHTCKVADFGFARDIIASHVYERKSEGRLPIRWMAPESLFDNIFSVKSDVWSFGVLMWEVVTLGSTPYPGMSAGDVMKKVKSGYRLDKPEHCRRELYNIMYYCWDKDPKQRPTFTECIELLEKLLMTETDYIELERFPDHSYYNMMSLSGEKL